MPTIRWLGPGVFTDHRRGYAFRPETDHDIDDEEEAERLLNHSQFSHRFERVDTDADDESAEDDDTPDETGDGSGDDENIGEDGEDVTESGSDTHSREDLEEMEYAELQRHAMDAETDEVNGRSSREDIIDALADDGEA